MEFWNKKAKKVKKSTPISALSFHSFILFFRAWEELYQREGVI
jgi:hypothetical protein